MNADQIRRFILKDPIARTFFGGVVSSNNIPRASPSQKPKFYIVNTDPDYKPGEHWVVLWNDHISNYFDPTGRFPFFEAEAALKRPWIWNSTRVQPLFSNKCGLFCLYFVYYKSRGYSMTDIVKSFFKWLRLNDKKVEKFYKFYR